MLVLASTSPRRSQILKEFNYEFIKDSPTIEENDFKYANISEYSANLAKMKAYSLYKKYPDDIILSCDTVVICDNKLLEKPINYEDALKMLQYLSGKTHFVLSSYTILYKEIEISKTCKTYIKFKNLNDNDIKKYLNFNTYLDKAGSYAIQDPNCNFVESYKGSMYNVIGLPIEEISKNLAKLNYFPKSLS